MNYSICCLPKSDVTPQFVSRKSNIRGWKDFTVYTQRILEKKVELSGRASYTGVREYRRVEL